MRPELFTLPFVNISVKSYGLMMVLGFVAALFLAGRLCRKLSENPEILTNFGIIALVAGVVGARLMHVLHNWPDYRGNLKEVFAIWSGGLEFIGGVAAALVVMLIYFKWKNVPILKYLDILAPALMLGLAFGRIGCFLNGCCFGAACDLPWAIRFPAVNHLTGRGPGCEKQNTLQYSYPYDYQLRADYQRQPGHPVLLKLPEDYYDGYIDGVGRWVEQLDYLPSEQRCFFNPMPKPAGQLSEKQLGDLENGLYPMHPVHPAQLYSVVNALWLCLFLSWLLGRRKYQGQIFAWLLILYGITRFLLEMLRTEPMEFAGLTISQLMGGAGVLAGMVMIVFCRRRFAVKG